MLGNLAGRRRGVEPRRQDRGAAGLQHGEKKPEPGQVKERKDTEVHVFRAEAPSSAKYDSEPSGSLYRKLRLVPTDAPT